MPQEIDITELKRKAKAYADLDTDSGDAPKTLARYIEDLPPATVHALCVVVDACMNGYWQGSNKGRYLPPDVRHALEPFIRKEGE